MLYARIVLVTKRFTGLTSCGVDETTGASTLSFLYSAVCNDLTLTDGWGLNESLADQRHLWVDTSLQLSMRVCDEEIAEECSPYLKKNMGRFHVWLNSHSLVSLVLAIPKYIRNHFVIHLLNSYWLAVGTWRVRGFNFLHPSHRAANLHYIE